MRHTRRVDRAVPRLVAYGVVAMVVLCTAFTLELWPFTSSQLFSRIRHSTTVACDDGRPVVDVARIDLEWRCAG